MIDAQIREIIDKTFREVDILVKEVQERKKFEHAKLRCSGREESLVSNPDKDISKVL